MFSFGGFISSNVTQLCEYEMVKQHRYLKVHTWHSAAQRALSDYSLAQYVKTQDCVSDSPGPVPLHPLYTFSRNISRLQSKVKSKTGFLHKKVSSSIW